ncbi:hypothetical protein FN846DRAFT_890998 [Sphaerosporella brunnea]|uniref:Uncharacterized protein n=1 Tax=Sphaerosporella brunnea TaxID=1250544 RepID=A0A5J5EV09_9PEZI|nr:hypothetical protein FN846DRAFT_890998 [Sphaerosporella brunnea]
MSEARQNPPQLETATRMSSSCGSDYVRYGDSTTFEGASKQPTESEIRTESTSGTCWPQTEDKSHQMLAMPAHIQAASIPASFFSDATPTLATQRQSQTIPSPVHTADGQAPIPQQPDGIHMPDSYEASRPTDWFYSPNISYQPSYEHAPLWHVENAIFRNLTVCAQFSDLDDIHGGPFLCPITGAVVDQKPPIKQAILDNIASVDRLFSLPASSG